MAALAAMPAAAYAQHSKLSLESIGPAGGNGVAAADLVGSQDAGKRVFLTTAEQLTAADNDSSVDLYSRTGGLTTLLSAGTGGGNGAYPANYGRARQGGTRVFFQSDERLDPSDTDSLLDVYVRDGSTTTLVSTGPGSGANGPYDSLFAAASADGQRVFFVTRGALVGADTDSSFDVYERSGSTTTLISTGPSGGNGALGAELAGISDDGTKVFFHTAESLVASDTDEVQDVYQRAGGVTTNLSVGPSGGGGVQPAMYDGSSLDGSKVFFRTAESLMASDTDAGIDVYERANGTATTIHSISPSGGNSGAAALFAGASQDGSKVFVESMERLIAAPVDRDSQNDVYQSAGGTLTQVSTGGNDVVSTPAYFTGASADGNHVFIRSEEALAAGDTDEYQDIYEVTGGGSLTRVSIGPGGGNGPMHAFFGGASADGTRMFFETYESLVAGDTDASIDVYERSGGATEHVSAGVSGGNGTFDASFRAVSSDGQRVFFRTAESLLAADTDGAPDLYSANVPGTVTVNLDAIPDDPQDFSFQAFGLDDGFAFGPPNFGPTLFDLDDDANPTLANQHVFTGVTPGVGYSVTQDAVVGWDQTAATCDNGSPPTAIDVQPGQDVNCTFTNQKRGQIVVVLDSVPNDPQDFGFTAGGGLTPASFQLDDDSDGTLSNTLSFTNVAVGSGYSVSPGALPPGWSQASASCSDGSPVSNINVGAGETVTCTFTNNKPGQIVVVKDAQPNDSQDFSFTAGGGLSPASFQLDDDANGTLSNTRTFTNVTTGGGYSLSETVPSGWDQSSAICSDGSPVSNINVGPGEIVTCTFTNVKRGQVVIVQDTVPSDPQDFSFTAGGGLTPTSFVLDDHSSSSLPNTITFANVQARNGYFVSQTVPSGWGLTSATCDDGSPVANIDVAAGETVTCTFVDQQDGTLTIIKDAQPNDSQNFSFSTSGGLSPSSFQLDDDFDGTLSNTRTFTELDPGNYSVSETSIPGGWELISATCSDGSPVSNIGISFGENVTCTFTNQKRGQIVVVKDAQPNDPQDFSFTAGGGLSPASFQLDDDANLTLTNSRIFNNVPVGSGYSLAETVPSGWLQSSAVCNDGSPVSNITVSAGESILCTFTNQKRGSITVVKDATPDDPQDFSFTAGGGLSPASFQLDNDGDGTLSNTRTFSDLAPGSGYSLSETVPAGWDQTGATCNDGSSVSNINLASGENVTCTFSNRKRGQIVVIKDATPNDPQDFGFTAGGGLSPSSFSLDDDSDGTLSNTRTFANLVPGSGFSLSETLPGGWEQTSAICDDGSSPSDIGVSAGEVVTCTFSNRKRASLVVVKDAQPNDPQNFSFTAGGGLSPSSFSLDDDSDGTLSNTRTFNDVSPGSGYSLAETVPGGWSQQSAVCSDGSPVSNISVSVGETVTCTFVNQQPGTIVIVENSTPNDPQDFSFTAGGGLSPAGFQLDDDSNPVLPSSQTFTNVAPGSGYSFSETVPGGWDQISATCDDSSPVTNVDVAPGETVTCTFLNRKRGEIVVTKEATPEDPQDFGFTAGGGLSPTSFQLDDDIDAGLDNTQTFNDVPVGSGYSIAESVPAGWEQTGATCDDGSSVTNIVINAGETVTCTFQNRKLGQIVVVKDAVPDHSQDFSFTAGGGLSPASFQLDDDSNGTLSNTRTFANLSPGSGYSLSETVPPGWTQTGASCDDGSPVTGIDVAPGEIVTCTFDNQQGASIVVIKDATPNDPQDFSFTAGGGLSPSSFSLDDDSDGTLSNTRSFNDLSPGSGYSLSEALPAGWDQTGATCDDGSPVTGVALSAGETVTCTFSNRKRGKVVVVENAIPNDAQDFSYTAGGGLTPTSFALDDDADGTLAASRTFDDVVPGSGYSLSQTPPSGWDLASATCDDGSPVASISVAAGETVTCTFTHERQGSITVVKDAQPNDPHDFSFTAGGGLSPASFALDDDADGTLSNTRTFSGIPPQSGYSLTEGATSGWDLSSVSCDDGSPASNIAVAPGEHVTCTFTNRKRGQIVVVQDSQPNDAQDFGFTAGGGLSPGSFQLDDDSNPTLANTRTFTDLQPQNGYSISQALPAGWHLLSATCDDGSPVSNIDVGAGETVTCTFTNDLRSRIVVIKDALPNDPQNFNFTAGGGLSPSFFQLDDDSDGTLSNTRTFYDLIPGSGYSLSEALPTGWSQVIATCDDGSPVSNIALTAGETVTCTFLNQRGYPRPLGATPLKTPLVPAYTQCQSPNRTHGPALTLPSCNPPAQTSSHLTVGTPDANGRAPGMSGVMAFEVIVGFPPTPPDGADVTITSSMTDIRLRSSLNDYAGQLQGTVTTRITDRLSGAGQNEMGTVTDVPLSFTIPCTVTADTAIGSTCAINTTADALLAGMVTETKRTIWQMSDVRVYDGGPDGQASTQDNTLFLRQGVFVP